MTHDWCMILLAPCPSQLHDKFSRIAAGKHDTASSMHSINNCLAEHACSHYRLRQLVRRLETSVGVRPWPKAISSPEAGAHSYRTLYYMGLRKRAPQMTATTLSRASNTSVNLNGPVNEFRHLVMNWDDWQEGMDVMVRHMRQKDLPSFVLPEGMS